MLQEDSGLRAKLGTIGKPRIIEVAVPFTKTNRTWAAARSIVSTFFEPDGKAAMFDNGFDAYSSTPLDSKTIINIHSEGDASFYMIGM